MISSQCFEHHSVTARLPVVEYSREFQAHVAKELALLQEGSVIAELLSGSERRQPDDL